MNLKYSIFLIISVVAAVFVTMKVGQWEQPEQDKGGLLTTEQGEAILKELADIRATLSRIEKQIQSERRPSTPKTARAPTKGRPTLGNPDAGITVVEFTDYQCPFCSRFANTTFDRLQQEYIDSGKVRWVVLNMPLSFHKEAQMASLAAHCADEQGKFWEYRALLYMNQDKLKPEHLTQYALQIGLNAEAFNICINGNRYAELIQQDMKAAQMERITGTPTFVIGKSTSDVITGKRIVGAQAYQVFSNEIERLLQVSR